MFGIISLSAQDYFKIDTVNISWNERVECGEPPTSVILKYIITGDTIIDGLKYFKILETSNEVSKYIGCFREENKIVKYIGEDYWGFHSDTAVVLYDFNKTIGDTINTGTWHQNIIVAIDSVLIENTYRKQFSMKDGQKWIEGIGSTFGFRYPMTDIPACYWECELACFKKEENVIYLNPRFTDCETLTNINNKEIILGLTVFPNPLANGEDLTIISTSGKIESIDIFSVSGVLVFSKSYEKSYKVIISTLGFKTGFFILKVVSENGFNTKKIIIE